jgi:hypothetical protein
MHLKRAQSAPAGLPDVHEHDRGDYTPDTRTVAVLTDYGAVEYPAALLRVPEKKVSRACLRWSAVA